MTGRPPGLLARAALIALLSLSLALAGWSALRILRDPLIRPVAERTAEAFAAALERDLARTATPDVIAARLRVLLAETPRNWVAIASVEQIATERGLSVPPEVEAARQDAWDKDSSLPTRAGDCLRCTWDAGECTVSTALLCNAPVTLTPVGDVLGLGRAAVAKAAGDQVDRLDLALSIVGLGATAAILASGGTSYTLKIGASVLRLARRMSLLPPRLLALIADAARYGIRWDRALELDSLADPARLLNPKVVAPVAAVASDLGRIHGALDAPRTLHLLRYIDGPAESARIARGVETLGPRAVGVIEVLGKSRFMRAALRWTDEALALAAGLAGLMISLGLGLASLVQGMILRRLRRRLWRGPR